LEKTTLVKTGAALYKQVAIASHLCYYPCSGVPSSPREIQAEGNLVSAVVPSTTELNIQNHKTFKAWLRRIKPSLAKAARKRFSADEVEAWFRVLLAALAGKPLKPLLAELSLSVEDVAGLFHLMHRHLPAQNSALSRQFAAVQRRTLTAVATLTPPPQTDTPLAERLARFGEQLRQIPAPDAFLQHAASLIAQIFPYPSINIFLRKNTSQTVKLQAALWRGVPPSPEEMAAFDEQIAATDNIVRQTLADGQPRLAPRPAYTAPPPMTNLADEMAIPLRGKEHILGVLHLVSHAPHRLAGDDLSVARAIAASLAMEMENARLQTLVRRRNYEQRIILESNIAVGSKLQPDEILALLARKITEGLQAGACVISRWHEGHNTLTAIAQHIRTHKDNPSRTWRTPNDPLPLAQDAIGQQVLKTMRPLAIRVEESAPPESRPPWAEPGWKSLLAFPLLAQGQKLGLVEVFDRDARRNFTLEDIQLGRALAAQATVAVEQVELFRQTRQRLTEVSTLFTLSQQIIASSALRHEELLESIVTIMREIVDCRACVLFLLDETKEYLEIKAASGLKTQWKKSARLAVGEGAAGQAVAQKKTIYIPDTTQDPSFIFFDTSIRSLIVVPMIFQGEVIGAINLDDTRPNAFDESQERLLAIAANQAAIAINNANLLRRAISEEQRTRAIIQHMADGLLLINHTGEIVRVNPALGVILNMHPSEIIGRNIHEKHLPPRLAAICAPLTEKKRTGLLTREVELPGTPPTIVRTFATAVTDENKQPIGEVRVVHDVTQERELERMKDDFVSVVSHELRTPLFSIQGFVRLMLEDEVPDPQTRREFLTIIERQANQLAEMVSNLLDVSKLASGTLSIEKKPVQLIDVINQTVLKLQGFARNEKVNLTSELPTSLPLIFGDAQRLEQVMTNLIGNAIKFTPAGGRVTVMAQRHDDHILIAIADTGIGIAPKDLKRIFTKFYQVEEHKTRTVQGSGLGLHISKRLIESHGGKIWAESELGKGSTFYIQLKVADFDAQPMPARHETD